MPKAKKSQSSLGKSLMNKKRKDDVSKAHTTDFSEPQDRLKSVIDQSSLKDFLQEVELSSRNFEALKETKVKTEHHVIDLNTINNLKPKIKVDDNMILTIPRRPKWNASTTPEQLTQLENDSFLNWRRNLARIEEELLIDRTMTPFEKNLEVWKQLWRVTEKSDILVQVVDGRNPMFYRCPDLEKYVKEINSLKENILLINKSDLLSDDIRNAWTRYLNANGVNHIFFSAKKEQEKIDTDKIDEEEAQKEVEEFTENTSRIFTRKNLLTALTRIVLRVRQQKHQSQDVQEQAPSKIDKSTASKHVVNPDLVVIGMVGYPNVGKSSVINVLSKKKLVGVAAQPGKTKHFQTLYIEKDLMLCDCPGLVFPNFTSNRSEMVCNGVLPIDKLKDYLSPIQYLCLRIPKEVFEALYKYKIEFKNPTGSQVLQAYSKNRGHLTGSALPDEAKAARIFLKDLVNGKLLFCALPPDYNKERDGNIIQYNTDIVVPIKEEKKKVVEESKTEEDPNNVKEETQKKEEDDDEEENLGDQSRIQINDDEFFEGETAEADGEDPYEGCSNEELLLLLLEGKAVRGIRLNKNQRRDLKFALKRGEKIDISVFAKGNSKAATGVNSLGAHGKTNFMRARNPIAESEEK